MVTSLYPDGLGGTVDIVATDEPFYGLDSTAWYVHFGTGVDGAAPIGRDRQNPLKTIGQAITNATAYDVIVLLDGHSEVITTTLAVPFAKTGLVIVGCGQTAGVPNTSLIHEVGPFPTLTFQANSCQMRNVRITGNGGAFATAGIISVVALGFTMDRCYFNCPASTPFSLSIGAGAGYMMVKDTTFIASGPSKAASPASAIACTAVVSQLTFDGVEVSDGEFGFTSNYAIDFNGSTITGFRGDKVSLLLGASMRIGANTTGYIIPTVTGGGVIDI